MKTNSVSSPSFGCGACAAAYRQLERLKSYPVIATDIEKAGGKKPLVQGRIKEGIKKSGYTHGTAASLVNESYRSILTPGSISVFSKDSYKGKGI